MIYLPGFRITWETQSWVLSVSVLLERFNTGGKGYSHEGSVILWTEVWNK